MEKVPNGRYTKEFREEAVKMLTDGGLSVLEVSSRLSLPKSTLERWRRVSK
jgi:transposase